MNKFLIIYLLSYLFYFQAQAVEPQEVLKNTELEDRARKISKLLRCLVCQNEDIDNSNADIAKDLRNLIREQLLEGKSNKDIINFVHSKYGDFILYRPPFKPHTLFLWIFPIVLFFFFIFIFFKKPK